MTTPLTDAAKSVERRRATLQLSGDGTLEGTISKEITGHIAEELRAAIAGQTAAEREEDFKRELKAYLNTTDFSDYKIENADDPDKPLVVTYKLRVPGYATRTGKRLFIQPAFFEVGVAALFTASERKSPICFHYPWSESIPSRSSFPKATSWIMRMRRAH